MNPNARITEERQTGFIRKLNFKRTWGVIVDEMEQDYYFDIQDIDRDAYALSEGLAVTFLVIAERHSEAGTELRAMAVRVES